MTPVDPYSLDERADGPVGPPPTRWRVIAVRLEQDSTAREPGKWSVELESWGGGPPAIGSYVEPES